MIGIRERLLAAFQVEYKEHLESIRTLLTQLEGRASNSRIAEWDETFRRAHSLKGAARAVDLRPVEAIAHRLETLFAKLRQGSCSLDAGVLTVTHQALDAIEDWVTAYTAGQGPADPLAAQAAIDALVEGLEAPAPAAPEADDKAAPAEPQPMFMVPSPVMAEPAPTPPPPEPPRPSLADESVRVRASHLDRLMRSANELVTEIINQGQMSAQLAALTNQVAELDGAWKRMRKTLQAVAKQSDQEAVLNRHAEAVEQQLRSVQRLGVTTRRRQAKTGWTLRQLGQELQQELRQARMVPADSVFGGFRKMLRDLAKDAGKDISPKVLGLEVEADRLALQALKDPVLHLLRNAVGHGVETPPERRAKGKPPVGEITLKFEVLDGRLVVTVEDDGRGLDLDAIAAKAVSQGLTTATAAATCPSEQIVNFIFDPGFSTAKSITDLSGRGMGLSVVRETAARMNGSTEVQARRPAGTRFRLSVPLSVATQRLFLVNCQGQTYGIPTDGIDRLCRVKMDELTTVEGRSVVSIDGRQVPLLALGQVLGLGDATVKVSRGLVPTLVLRNSDRRVAVAVDGFLGLRDSMIKGLGLPATRGSKVSGGMVLEDGSIALILNPFEIVEAFRRQSSAHALSTTERTAEARPPVILVVDDSLTTRTLEKSILEAHGYTVQVAVDGVEALNMLRLDHYDLVVTDVQMPRLDGFGLLQAIKNDPALADIPVIVVTSLERKEDQERGLSLGADAYVVKRKFDQQELLETIRQIL
ncbi:MAG TPA: response regulator [Patescibacteria group bacterium]|nr:response regulator [Patescibacteria group bacterium]